MTFTKPSQDSKASFQPLRPDLPTMYDLPSEFPEEPGLPDIYHDLQPEFLSNTLRLQNYPPNEYFTGTDLNVYYDEDNPLWHKRPDWFLAVRNEDLIGSNSKAIAGEPHSSSLVGRHQRQSASAA
ncbi:MAG: Uma2 family endonuclease [Phormidesmis sp.]